MNFLTSIRLLLIALWLGAACFFIAVAQSAFAVLPSPEIAGSIVSRTLMILNLSGLIIGAILLASSFIKRPETRGFWIWAERFLLLILVASGAVGQFVFALWLSFIRAQIGGRPIEEVAADDPLKIQFDTIHQYSVWVLLAGMIAALLVFFLIARKTDKTLTSEKINVQYN